MTRGHNVHVVKDIGEYLLTASPVGRRLQSGNCPFARERSVGMTSSLHRHSRYEKEASRGA